MVGPERLDQPVHRQASAALGDEDRRQQLRFRSADWDHLTEAVQFETTKDSELRWCTHP
jgi:hypothetical protein